MNARQKKFADNYIETGNAEQSAIDAGYSERYARGNAYKMVAKSGIKEYIDERMKELEKKKIAKQDEVLQYLTSLMRGEETEQTLIGLGGGEQDITEIEVSSKERLRAAELLGRRYALFTDKQDIDIKVPTIIFDIEDDIDGED